MTKEVLSSNTAVPPPPWAKLHGCHSPEKTVIVYQNAKGTGEAAVEELLARARIVVPALMNYLFFSSAHVAVLYLGKNMIGTKKLGVEEGAVDMKIRMIRYLTTEMWPPLLRTDAPDESYIADILHSDCGESFFDELLTDGMDLHRNSELGTTEDGSKEVKICRNSNNSPTVQRSSSVNILKQFIFDSKMEVLVYLKNGIRKTKYLKLILRNTMHRLHFDVIDPKDEKHRWEERKLFTRILDNLETRKGIPSFEAYEGFFREACTMTARLPIHHALLDQRLTICIHPREGIETKEEEKEEEEKEEEEKEENREKNCSKGVEGESRYYPWMIRLSRPEGSMLDYKSYIFDTVSEVNYNCVRFLCGFLNAYREGKLLIGVHEIPKRNVDGSTPPIGDGKNTIVRHDDLVDQYVVGLHITQDGLKNIQESLSKQLLDCVPPVPPQTVCMDVIPVKLPLNFTRSKEVVVFFDEDSSPYGVAIKQKIFSAMHNLVSLGLSLVQVESKILREKFRCSESMYDDDSFNKRLGLYVVAPLHSSATLKQENWEESLARAFENQRNRCWYQCVDDPGDVSISSLSIIEISIDMKRSPYIPLRMYKGKFFSGWPSIPIWDNNTKTVRRIERNHNIFRYFMTTSSSINPFSQNEENNLVAFTLPGKFAEQNEALFRRAAQQLQQSWFTVPQIASLVLTFLGDTLDCLRFRLLHSVCDMVFERQQGTHLLQMLLSTPLGNSDFSCSWSILSWMQNEMRAADIAPMPLLLCRVFESIGALPSPFPYVAVPLAQQSFRVSKYLVPLFYLQSYYDGLMRPSIVLDVRDGIVKKVRLQSGSFVLSAVIGVGFERITRRQLSQFLYRENMIADDLAFCSDEAAALSIPMQGFLTPSLRFAHTQEDGAEQPPPLTLNPSENTNTNNNNNNKNKNTQTTSRDVEKQLPLLYFKFLTGENIVTDDSLDSEEHGGNALMTAGTQNTHKMPWTLSHILSWFNVLSSDDHVQPFGYCGRSLCYRVESLHDICVEHVEGSNGLSTRIQLADSPQNCLLHKKIEEWQSI
ncbi:putative protein kinase [Trypanosoma theileri]|uniref:Uncharacterized protein n=1 Tax=Trypanosoma theileri TaxID=67003 RepID=A0A1X0P8B7_9TRYP|nr:putative protein kinase [Trypanosoma theileri]ORC93118.1 putative protein kinase [Trypanosoma theileri]